MQRMHEVDREGGEERDTDALPHAVPSWEISAQERVKQAESALEAMEQSLAAPQFSRFAWSELTAPSESHSEDIIARHAVCPSPEVNLHILVGRTRLSRKELESLGPGAVVALEQSIEEPIEIQVDGRVVARGEILLHQDRYCIRVLEVLASG